MIRFPEILAPVGGESQLRAAVLAGADAVYLAGQSFGARSSAKNFDRKALAEAVRYAHIHGVSVYVTVNTLILDEEMAEAVDFVDYLYEIGADAVIVQDIGLAGIIRERHPDLPLHASTQMTFHNVEGVRYAKEMGFSRVVLPREMEISEIRDIAAAVDIELEVFIHGALCVSYSGMCLMSSYIGGRSGNRGSCAQPCRKKYDLFSTDDARTFDVSGVRVLSPKDLSTAEYLDELKLIPKISLKIEGRLKDYDYVYNVVAAYRGLLDGAVSGDEASAMLERSYNRGYTKGFVFSEDSVDWHAGLHTGNRGVPLGTVVSSKPTFADLRENAESARRERSAGLDGNGYEHSAKSVAFCEKSSAETEYYSKDGRRYVVVLRLADSLCVGDEIQYKMGDGRTVGARAEWIMLGGKRVESAPVGSVVSVPFGCLLRAGDALDKTYSVEHIASVDAAMNVQPKRWSVALRAAMRPGEAVQIEAELRPLGGSCGGSCGGKFGAAVPFTPAAFAAATAAPASSHSAAPAASPPLHTISLRGPTVQVAAGRGTDASRVVEQLSKFGGSPFELDVSLSHFDIAQGIFLPISDINALRRQIIDIFTEYLVNRYPSRAERIALLPKFSIECALAKAATYAERKPSNAATPGACSVLPGTEHGSSFMLAKTAGYSVPPAAEPTDGSFVPDIKSTERFPSYGEQSGGSLSDFGSSVAECHSLNCGKSDFSNAEWLRLPALIPGERWQYYQSLVDRAQRVEIGHLSQLNFSGLSGKEVRAAYTINAFNSFSVKFLRDRGVGEIEISPEIQKSRLQSLSDIVDVSDRSLVLMRMKYCPVGAYFGGGRRCGLCQKYSFALRDEFGIEYPLRLDSSACSAELLSPYGKKGKKLSF